METPGNSTTSFISIKKNLTLDEPTITLRDIFESNQLNRSNILKCQEILNCFTKDKIEIFIEKFKKILSSPSPLITTYLKTLLYILKNDILVSDCFTSCKATYFGIKQCLADIAENITGINIENDDVNIILVMCTNPGNLSDKVNGIFEELNLGHLSKDGLIYNQLMSKLAVSHPRNNSIFKATDSSTVSEQRSRLFSAGNSTRHRALPVTPVALRQNISESLESHNFFSNSESTLNTTTLTSTITKTYSPTNSTSTTPSIITTSTSTSAPNDTVHIGIAPPARPQSKPQIEIIYLPDLDVTSLEQKKGLSRKDILGNEDIMKLQEVNTIKTSSKILAGKISQLTESELLKFKYLIDILTNVLSEDKSERKINYYGVKVWLSKIFNKHFRIENEDVDLVFSMCIHKNSGNSKYTQMTKGIFVQAKISERLDIPFDKPLTLTKIDQTIEYDDQNKNIFQFLACDAPSDARSLIRKTEQKTVEFKLFSTNPETSLTKFWRKRKLDRELILNNHTIKNCLTIDNLNTFVNKLKGKVLTSGEWYDNPTSIPLTNKTLQDIRYLIDTLIGYFYNNTTPSKLAVTFNGVWNCLESITSEYNIDITVDEVNLILRLCTSEKSSNYSPKKYNKFQKQLLLAIGLTKEIVKGKIGDNYISGNKNSTEICDMLSNNVKKIDPTVIIKNMFDIFALIECKKYEEAFARIDEITTSGRITLGDFNEESNQFLELASKDIKWFENIKKAIELALSHDITDAITNNNDVLIDFKKVIINVFEFDLPDFNKRMLLNLIREIFPRICFRVFTYKSGTSDYKFNNFYNQYVDYIRAQIQSVTIPLSGGDLINTSLGELQLTLESFDNITSLHKCGTYKTTLKIKNGPKLIGTPDKQLTQLSKWYKGRLAVTNTTDDGNLRELIIENLDRLTVEALLKIRNYALETCILPSLQGEIDEVLDLSANIRIMYEKKIENISNSQSK